MKTRLTIDITKFDDGTMTIIPTIKGDLTVEMVLIIVASLLKSLNMNWFKIIWELIKKLGVHYEDLD